MKISYSEDQPPNLLQHHLHTMILGYFGSVRSSVLPSLWSRIGRTAVQVARPMVAAYSTSVPFNQQPYAKLEKRKTAKDILSRKTFLIDYYKYLNDTNEIVLFVHHNNINKTDNQRLRSDLKKHGAKLNIIRNNLYEVYLRSEHEADPASTKATLKNKDVKHPLTPLLSGPTGIITIPSCDPTVATQVLKIITGAQERLILMGAKIESNIYDLDQVNHFKNLPSKEQLQSQLAGLLTVLGGAGLVRTLESASNVLYLTLEELRKDMDPNESSNGSADNDK